MDVLTANGLFSTRKTREILPYDFSADGIDYWPAYATAAAMLAGCLEDAVSDDDLDEGVNHFLYLFKEGIVTPDAWKEAVGEVIEAVLAWGNEREMAAAPNN